LENIARINADSAVLAWYVNKKCSVNSQIRSDTAPHLLLGACPNGVRHQVVHKALATQRVTQRPIHDALHDFMEGRLVERAFQTGMIEIAPLAFMRGRTLSNALFLLDEAQTASSMQMKMFLTRLGEGSRMIITGDPTQVDLPSGQRSGFAEAIALLADLEGIGHVKFGHQHVVRHDLVRRIVQAYEERGQETRG
jgi:phosphate starvation-inducible protein PhoH